MGGYNIADAAWYGMVRPTRHSVGHFGDGGPEQ